MSDTTSNETSVTLTWNRVASDTDLPEGRVMTVSVNQGGSIKQICLTHFKGQYAALDNACPHQGGPLGEGSIECDEKGDCYLRCPWHGWDFDPLTGKPPGRFDDGIETYPVEQRGDGIYVGLESTPEHARTVTDVMAETMVNWGVTQVFGMVGHSNLGLADALRRQTDQGNLIYTGIRHEGAAAFAASAFGKLTGRPRGVPHHRRPGGHEPAYGVLGRERRSRPRFWRSLVRSTSKSLAPGRSRNSPSKTLSTLSPSSATCACPAPTTPS